MVTTLHNPDSIRPIQLQKRKLTLQLFYQSQQRKVPLDKIRPTGPQRLNYQNYAQQSRENLIRYSSNELYIGTKAQLALSILQNHVGREWNQIISVKTYSNLSIAVLLINSVIFNHLFLFVFVFVLINNINFY